MSSRIEEYVHFVNVLSIVLFIVYFEQSSSSETKIAKDNNWKYKDCEYLEKTELLDEMCPGEKMTKKSWLLPIK